MTSSKDISLCQHPNSATGNGWAGGPIELKHNGQTVATIPGGFTVFEHCVEVVDVANDRLQLQQTSSDGVCITGLFINGSQLLVGKNDDLQSFWIDADELYCHDNFLSSTQITIQNGQVSDSTCGLGSVFG